MTELTPGRAYVTAVAVVGQIPTRRLRRMERRLRALALRGELGRPGGLAVWAATRTVLRDRSVQLAESDVMPSWWSR